MEKILTIEQRLQEICIEQAEYAELWSSWNLNKKILDPILNAIIKDYPHYSFHDNSHSESILLNIERVLGNSNVKKLSPTDLWLLLHVAYLHDFGMVILDTKICEIWKSDEFQEFIIEKCSSSDTDEQKAAKIIAEFGERNNEYDLSWPLQIKKAVTLLLSVYCRGQHADFSKQYILDIKDVWGIDLGHNGLIKQRLIRLIGEISVLHTKPFDDVLKLHKESNGFQNDYVHPRLVACLLRLGDVLDLDNGRFNTFAKELFGEIPDSSKRHQKKHESTRHVLVTQDAIEVEADCCEDDVYRETRRWFDALKNETTHLSLYWNDIAPIEFGRPPKLKECKLLRNGKDDLNELSNLRFKISQSKAFEILEGASIYKDRFACLREIIQNAEDASKIQLWRDIKNGIYYCSNGISKEKVENGTLMPMDVPSWILDIYSIEVVVEQNNDNKAVVTISDHGTGISIVTLKSICDVGQSYFIQNDIKNEIQEMPVWLRPTANFGIGLQSCFLVTDKFTISTKSLIDGALEIIFESGKEEGYVSVKSSCKTTRGSSVKVQFDKIDTFSYSTSGYTANSLRKIDPFENYCVFVYKAIETVLNECGSSFFNIHVRTRDDAFNELISKYCDSIEDGGGAQYIKEGEYAYYIDSDAVFNVWYKYNFFKVKFVDREGGGIAVSFKGKRVNKLRRLNWFNYPGISIVIDIYGSSAKDTLSLSRDELTSLASQNLVDDLFDVIQKYMDVLEMLRNDPIFEKISVDSYFLNSWLYEKKFPADLKNRITNEENIDVIKLVDDKYSISKCSLSDLKETYPYVQYINSNNMNSPIENSEKIEDVCEKLNLSSIDKNIYPIIVVDYSMQRFLERGYNDMLYCEIPGSDPLIMYSISDNDDLRDVDAFTQKCLISRLVKDETEGLYYLGTSIMRTAIPALKTYEKLATHLDGIYYINKLGKSRWFIISPISLDDKSKMKDFSEEAFVNYITEKPVFYKIVEHIRNNAKISGVTKEVIIEEYKKLIREYYKLME